MKHMPHIQDMQHMQHKHRTSVCIINDDRAPFDDDPSSWSDICLAATHAPLFAAAAEAIPPAPTILSLPTLSSSKLTDEQKLLLAQEKRGKKVPTEEEKKSVVEHAHAAGHFGEKAMYNIIDAKGYWWPNMRNDITDEIRECRQCQRYTTVRAGFHPARSVSAARPGDHFQIDLAQFQKSVDGCQFVLSLLMCSLVLLCCVRCQTKKRRQWQEPCGTYAVSSDSRGYSRVTTGQSSATRLRTYCVG
jgi:hypothetical protein